MLIHIKIPACLLLLFVAVLVSCLKETPLSVVIDIAAKNVAEHQTTPLVVQLTNATKGADFYEWTFEGGEPATSSEKLPAKVTFSTPGEQWIRWHQGVDEIRR